MFISNIFTELSFEIIATVILTLFMFLYNNLRQIIRNQQEQSNLVLSPDKEKICFIKTKNGNRDFYLVDINGNKILPLVTHPADDESPVWSPNSTQIAFVSNRKGTRNIYIINWDGTGLIELTNDGKDNHSPLWSFDGKKIIYKAIVNGSTMIKIIDLEEKMKNLSSSQMIS